MLLEDNYGLRDGLSPRGALIPWDARESLGRLATCLAEHKLVWDAISYVVTFREVGGEESHPEFSGSSSATTHATCCGAKF